MFSKTVSSDSSEDSVETSDVEAEEAEAPDVEAEEAEAPDVEAETNITQLVTTNILVMH